MHIQMRRVLQHRNEMYFNNTNMQGIILLSVRELEYTEGLHIIFAFFQCRSMRLVRMLPQVLENERKYGFLIPCYATNECCLASQSKSIYIIFRLTAMPKASAPT